MASRRSRRPPGVDARDARGGWRWRSWLVVGLCLASAGCLRSTRCLDQDPCDGRDNDCDGQIDEDFKDAEGRYVDVEHCGRCGVSCTAAFPTAEQVSCEVEQGLAQCKLVSCAAGEHPGGNGACVADVPALCLSCESDADCAARTPGASCNRDLQPPRCGQPCTLGCPVGFQCVDDQCYPEPSLCACEGVSEGFQLSCLVQGEADGVVCAGLRSCGPTGLGPCVLSAVELCNEEDDDCDGEVDEDFRDEEGRYISPLHCGSCGSPCASPGPNYAASCMVEGDLPRCDVRCEEGFVDVDGIRANGCECRLFDGQSAPVVVGGDLDCDGEPDDDDRFVHVTNAGDDANPGTILAPMRTIQAALARGDAEGKIVLVARGVYPGFAIEEGVNVFGGYRPDFRDRDVDLYPVFLEHETDMDGRPVLTCDDVDETTLVEGFTIVGQLARTAGQGSTALRLDGCGPELHLRELIILSARGADGAPGPGASQRLPDGVGSLAELDGLDGARGRTGDDNGQSCLTLAGGGGGTHACGAVDVSGGDGGESGCPDLGCRQGAPCANAGCTDFSSGGECDLERVLSLAVPNPAPEAGRGPAPGAAGAVTYDAPTNRGVCNFCDDNPTLPRVAGDGVDGADGVAGTGGAGCGEALLSVDAEGRGRVPAGGDGSAGSDGSGGGGGSAGGGYARIEGTTGSCDDNAGGSGGGGGSGGCGAPAGGGGAGGGASIGIAVRVTGPGPTFEQVRVVTDNGGRGGDGGQGAAGGRGGSGAAGGGNLHWCARAGGRGGDGGNGGAGGGGGGGCGGASHALVVLGDPDDSYVEGLSEALEIERPGVSGRGGRGGSAPGASGGNGVRGSGASVVQL